MGEIADMILDGTLCEGCGVFIEEDNMCHVPRSCRDCMDTDRIAEISRGASQLASEMRKTCPKCGKHVKWNGLDDHMRDKHGAGSAELAKPGDQP